MANTVVSFFDSETEASEAVEQLIAAGFDRSDIDLSRGTRPSVGNDYEDTFAQGDRESASGVGDYHKTTGSEASKDEHSTAVGRFFRSLFGDDEDANRYTSIGERSASIVSVHVDSDDRASLAADILDRNGARDINDDVEGFGSNWEDSDFPGENDQQGQNGKINRVQEELQVGKRAVQTGGVRVRSKIVSQPVEETIRLRSEHVFVDRKAVNKPVDAAAWQNFRESEINLTETAEVPVVNKEARIVEEISVGKTAEEHAETIKDDIRHTEVDVEPIEGDKWVTKDKL